MKKKITVIIVLALLCLNFYANAQNKAVDVVSKGLQIGAQMPDLTLNNLHNYRNAKGERTTTAKISDFKGKLLILDFWATWCAPCVAIIPRMDSLQAQFTDKLQILSVTYESEKTGLSLLSSLEQRGVKSSKLVNVFEDKELHKLFPHVYLPHYVWIDANGIITAITDAKPINAKEVSEVLATGYQQLARKQDFKLAFDKTKPLFLNGNGGDGTTVTYSSLLATYIQGLSSSHFKKPPVKGTEGFARMAIKNWGLVSIYRVAIGGSRKHYAYNKIILETKDSVLLDTEKQTGDLRSLRWCYELTLPPALQPDGYRLMYEDLNRLFPQYNVKVEKRVMTCYALKVIDKNKLRPTSGEPRDLKHHPNALQMRNGNLTFMVNALEFYYHSYTPIPIIDLSEYAENIDIDINANLSDIDAVNQELQQYGLAFVKGQYEIDMIVFRDAIK